MENNRYNIKKYENELTVNINLNNCIESYNYNHNGSIVICRYINKKFYGIWLWKRTDIR